LTHVFVSAQQRGAATAENANRLLAALQAEGISGVFGGYTTPLYANPMFVDRVFLGGGWPVDAF
jgi:hypothetical protein